MLGVDKADWDEAFAWADDDDAGSGGDAGPALDAAFAVWPENWDVVRLFLKCETQWAFLPSGRIRGLDYPGVDVVMRRNRKLAPDRDAAFEQLQVMEFAARGVLNV